MLLFSLLSWWYGSGWGWLARELGRRLTYVEESFSVSILLKTLFSPWKQIRTQSTFQNFFQAAIDNLISRFIGAIVRFGLLLVAILSTFLIVGFGLALFILWPFLPLMIVVLPVMTLAGVEIW